ncbi:MAG: MarR family transcriptional regulator [Micrococcales bacterium]|nr:MarR family transcriptional regulator [Micrococcales bacterium]
MTARRDAVDAWESLYRASVAVQRFLAERFPDDLGQSEYDVLVNLYRAPGRAARIRDLHRHLLLTQPSVSRLVDRMAARGVVRKCSDATDARGTVVLLTEEGERLFRRIGAEHARVISDRMLAALSPAELRQLRQLSDALRGDAAPRLPTEADAVPRPATLAGPRA